MTKFGGPAEHLSPVSPLMSTAGPCPTPDQEQMRLQPGHQATRPPGTTDESLVSHRH